MPDRTLSALIFVLVTCAFATIYITQPVLPILESQFAIGPSAVNRIQRIYAASVISSRTGRR